MNILCFSLIAITPTEDGSSLSSSRLRELFDDHDYICDEPNFKEIKCGWCVSYWKCKREEKFIEKLKRGK